MKVLPKISIIIPVYKVEKYLNRCMMSIIGQTYTNLEIILVDDGSPDNCPELCDCWCRKDNRVHVIHKKNGGLSDARNAGIEAATGDYILFVDSDDYIMTDMCEKMIKVAEDTHADMVVCSFIWKYPTEEKVQSMVIGNTIQSFTNIELLKIFFMKKTVELTVAWNKLYQRRLFFTQEHIRYPVGKLHEDEFTTYRLIYEAKNITIIPDALYYYVQRDASIMSEFRSRNLNDSIEAAESYITWMLKHKLSMEKEVACAYDILSFSFYLRYLNNKGIDPGQKKISLFRKFILKTTPCIYLSSCFPLKCRIWDFLLRNNQMFIYHWVYFLKKKLK